MKKLNKIFNSSGILKSRKQIKEATAWVDGNGLQRKEIDCKNWDTSVILPELEDGNILDLGCSGSVLFENLKRLDHKGELYGVDSSHVDPIDGVKISRGSLIKTGLPSNHFDAITCLCVLQTKIDLDGLFQEIQRLLKLEGKLFVTFDYCEYKIKTTNQKEWNILSKQEVNDLIQKANEYGLDLCLPMNWEMEDLVIRPGYHSPDKSSYTFMALKFVKNRQTIEEESFVEVEERRKKVLMISHLNKTCGVYQFGHNIINALKSVPTRYDYEIVDCDNAMKVIDVCNEHDADLVIFNYHPDTMPYVNQHFLNVLGRHNLGFYHEITHNIATRPTPPSPFGNWICSDPTSKENNWLARIGRPLPKYNGKSNVFDSKNPIIGTFGLAFRNKGFNKLALMVSDEFESATLRYHIPSNPVYDAEGKLVKEIVDEIKSNTKSHINLEFSHHLMDSDELLNWLNGNDLNAFLYDNMLRGCSSTTDWALSVDRPIAISNSFMFRHLLSASSKICISNNSLKNILDDWYIKGENHLKVFKDLWSAENLAKDFDRITDICLSRTH